MSKIMTDDKWKRAEIEAMARAIWSAREEQFPERVRRRVPDNIDANTGAWGEVVRWATAAYEAAEKVRLQEADEAIAKAKAEAFEHQKRRAAMGY